MSDQCHCPEQGLNESCGMCKYQIERDALRERVNELTKALTLISNLRCLADNHPYDAFCVLEIAKAALSIPAGENVLGFPL